MGLKKDKFLTRKKYWFLLLVALVIAFSVVSVYTYQELNTPNYLTERKSLELYTLKGWYDHTATVEKENPLWPRGTELQNQPLYFSAIAPSLDGKFHFQINSPSSIDVLVNYQLKRVLSSSKEETVYWSKEETISTGTKKLGRERELQIPFVLNITEIKKEIAEIKDGLDFYGGNIALKVIALVDYQGEIGGQKINQEKEFLLLINPHSSYYEVSGKPFEQIVKEEVVQRVAVSHSNLEKATLITLPGILFLAIIGLAVTKLKYRPLTKEEIERLNKEKEYQKFREQISLGECPPELEKEKRVIKLKSLKDLVEIAIDMDKRVICDRERDRCFVVDGDILYLYQF